jgi:hypothetical protein
MTYSQMALDNDEKSDTCHFMNANADFFIYRPSVYQIAASGQTEW